MSYLHRLSHLPNMMFDIACESPAMELKSPHNSLALGPLRESPQSMDSPGWSIFPFWVVGHKSHDHDIENILSLRVTLMPAFGLEGCHDNREAPMDFV